MQCRGLSHGITKKSRAKPTRYMTNYIKVKYEEK